MLVLLCRNGYGLPLAVFVEPGDDCAAAVQVRGQNVPRRGRAASLRLIVASRRTGRRVRYSARSRSGTRTRRRIFESRQGDVIAHATSEPQLSVGRPRGDRSVEHGMIRSAEAVSQLPFQQFAAGVLRGVSTKNTCLGVLETGQMLPGSVRSARPGHPCSVAGYDGRCHGPRPRWGAEGKTAALGPPSCR